ncbi:MAG: hypothetical protein N2C14_32665, partial [Planctomycetales bacterium]
QLEIQVQRQGEQALIVMKINGRRTIRWEGGVSSLTAPNAWALRQPGQLAFGADEAAVLFRLLKLRVLSGKAGLL